MLSKSKKMKIKLKLLQNAIKTNKKFKQKLKNKDKCHKL